MRLTVRRISSDSLFWGAALWYYERTSYQGGYYEHPHVGQRCVRMAGL